MQEFILITRRLIVNDVDAGLQFLTTKKNVDAKLIGLGGASCASILGIEMIKKYRSIKILMFLSGPFDNEAQEKFTKSDIPVFTAASEDDSRAFDAMKRVFGSSKHPDSTNLQFKGDGHGTNMLRKHPLLESNICDWFGQRLRPDP